MICPTCHRPYDAPVAAPVLDDLDYRAQRLADALASVASYRTIAASRDAEGRHGAARVWRQEADKIEADSARLWGPR